jgi:SAM-dependent methyltransferase
MKLLDKIEKSLFFRLGDLLEKAIPLKNRDLYYSELLAQEFFPEKKTQTTSVTERLLVYQFRKKYDPANPSPYFRKLIKNHVWGGETGKQWHLEEAEDDPDLNKYARWRAIQIRQCQSFLTDFPQIEHIVEIGCGNGKYLQLLKSTLGNHYSYWGLDLSESQIKWNKTQYPEIHFFSGDANSIDSFLMLENVLYLTFGTLSCFTEPELNEWLHSIYNRKGFQAIGIAEWNIDYNPENEKDSRAMSPTLYNHSYSHKIRNAGFVLHNLEYIAGNSVSPIYVRTILTGYKK